MQRRVLSAVLPHRRPCAALGMLLVLAACGAKPDPQGEAIFYGREPLVARIVADPAPLPSIATRCVNCHEKDNVSPTTGERGAAYAPPLRHEALHQRQARRGGPPSRYDAASFCSLLRTGIDPAHIIISTVMPRYEIGDAPCAALWRYVESR